MSPKKKKRKVEASSERKPEPKLKEKKESEDELPPIFRSLPKAVLEVASKIGLRTNVSRNEIDQFVAAATNEKADVGVLTYSCKKTQEKVIEYGKVKREKFHKLRKRRKKSEKLNSKERKKLFKIDKNSDLRFDTFKEINEVWQAYMSKVVGDIKSDQDQLKLLRADYHGADIEVFSAKNPALVGLKGIIVQETKLTFKIINETDKMCVIPKVGTVFAFKLNGNLYKLNGSCINFNPHHRSRIKVKCRKFTEEF